MSWEKAYRRGTAGSRRMYGRAVKVLAGGVSHNMRFYEPYPIYVAGAKGKHIWDVDGNRFVDYWMGHTALILGHSPRPVVAALRRQAPEGLLYGMGSEASVELAEEIKAAVPCAELVRFCNTGAEATMYLVRLARGFTRRRVVIKMTGGWHGYNTPLNRGVGTAPRAEGAGILEEEQAHVVLVPYNDAEAASRAIEENREDLAAVFLEPMLGGGGCVPADGEYLKLLREMTERHGAILAFDEIITGFRVALGGAQELYGVRPDMATLGKVVGGGLPIGVVCGSSEIVGLADPRRRERPDFVSIGGGTFSENPLSMAAGLETLRYLRRGRDAVYPRLDGLGRELREGVDAAFAEEGVEAHSTGLGSLFLTHFAEREPRNAQDVERSDKAAARRYHLSLMGEGRIFVLPGHLSALSSRHARSDVRRFVSVTSKIAREMKREKKEGR